MVMIFVRFFTMILVILLLINQVFLMLIAKKLKMNNPYLVWVPFINSLICGEIVERIRCVGSGIKWLFFSLGCFSVILNFLQLKYYMYIYSAQYAQNVYSARSAYSANVATSYLDNQQKPLLLLIVIVILSIIVLVIAVLAMIQLGLALNECGYSTLTAVLLMIFASFLWSFLVFSRLDDLLKQRELEQWRLKQKHAESERKKLQQKQLEQQQLRQLQQQEQQIW